MPANGIYTSMSCTFSGHFASVFCACLSDIICFPCFTFGIAVSGLIHPTPQPCWVLQWCFYAHLNDFLNQVWRFLCDVPWWWTWRTGTHLSPGALPSLSEVCHWWLWRPLFSSPCYLPERSCQAWTGTLSMFTGDGLNLFPPSPLPLSLSPFCTLSDFPLPHPPSFLIFFSLTLSFPPLSPYLHSFYLSLSLSLSHFPLSLLSLSPPPLFFSPPLSPCPPSLSPAPPLSSCLSLSGVKGSFMCKYEQNSW